MGAAEGFERIKYRDYRIILLNKKKCEIQALMLNSSPSNPIG